MKRDYDFILAGGGAAGLSLACQLVLGPLRDKTVLMVDLSAKRQNDRTWCFWAAHPTWLDEITYRMWNRARVIGPMTDQRFNLAPYRYQMIRGVDFYAFARRQLGAFPNVRLLQGRVGRIEDGTERAAVTVDGQTFTAEWVFDSRFEPADFHPAPERYHYLKQHFRGWVVETRRPAFDPDTVTLFDFRTPQGSPQPGSMRFFYILPFSATQALVEYTLFSPEVLPPEAYSAAFSAYWAATMGGMAHTVIEEESGVIPMTDQPLPRRIGRRIMAIGTKGGRVKPSSGYAFLRICQDAAAVAASLAAHDHPFAVAATPARYRLMDSLMLQVMYRHGEEMAGIFMQLFQRNPAARIFRFLDEVGTPGENVQLVASLPAWPFVRALVKLKVLGRV